MRFKDITKSSQKCPHCGGPLVEYSGLMEKKDACYYKVKASAKVWPSAYASGRLVQCRKKGAANYGNKSESVAEGIAQDEAEEEYGGWRAEFVDEINYNTFEIRVTNARSKESANFIVRPVDMVSYGPTLSIETMDVRDLQTGQTESWTNDDPAPKGPIAYAISALFYDDKQLQKKLNNIIDTHNTKGQDMIPGLEKRRSIGQEVDSDSYIDSSEKTQAAMAKMKQGMAEGVKPEILFYAKIPDGSRVYARVKNEEQIARLQQQYRGAEIKTFDYNRPDILAWLEARGINLRKFTPGMVQTMYPGSRGHPGSTGLNEFAPGSGGDDEAGDDPYKYPKPKRYNRSADYFEQFEADHFDREDFDDDTGVFKGYWGSKQIAYFKFDNPARTGGNNPGMGWYYEPKPSSSDNSTAAPAVDNADERKQQELSMIRAFLKSGNRPNPDSQIGRLMKKHGMTEGAGQQLSVQQLAAISDEALDKAYGYGRSTPGNTFGWQANLKSAQYAKQMIDKGVTDIEAISDAIHKGWNTTAQAFVQNPEQFDDTAKLQAAGKLEAKLQQRAQLMKQNYAQLPDEEKEKDRVVARALLQAIRGLNEFAPPSSADDGNDGFSDDTLKRLAAQWWQGDEDPRVEQTLAAAGWEIGQDEGYDEGGVFVVRAGDVNGNSYISWPATELESGMEESALSDLPRPGKRNQFRSLHKIRKQRGLDEQGVAKSLGNIKMNEKYNPEYDDEAGMADNNLQTLARAVEGIDDLIQTGDNLPEWCQEKIAVAKSMLVAVWDYMYSEEASDEVDPEIDAMFEAMEQLVHETAHAQQVSVDLVWESFEALDDHMLYETAAWRRKEGKSKKGGLNAKGVASYRRENPGSKLQMAVTTKPSKLKPGSKAAKRRKSFCARMSGVKGPMKKPNGKPTRKALALRKWNC